MGQPDGGVCAPITANLVKLQVGSLYQCWCPMLVVDDESCLDCFGTLEHLWYDLTAERFLQDAQFTAA